MLPKLLAAFKKAVAAKFKSKPKKTTEQLFKEECDKRRSLWENRLAELCVDGKGPEDIGKILEENGRLDLERLDNEVSQMLVRSSIIMAAATLVFAVYAFKSNINTPGIFLALALCFAAIAFVASLVPLSPPIIRAWFQHYVSRYEWTLLTHDHFTHWVMYCWLGERRTPVITKYKRAHAAAVPMLVVAAVILAFGLVFNLFW